MIIVHLYKDNEQKLDILRKRISDQQIKATDDGFLLLNFRYAIATRNINHMLYSVLLCANVTAWNNFPLEDIGKPWLKKPYIFQDLMLHLRIVFDIFIYQYTEV